MTDFKLKEIRNIVDEKERARRLSLVYSQILSWIDTPAESTDPHSIGKETESVVEVTLVKKQGAE